MTRQSRPTIQDIARQAGVSQATVSRVMNKNANVSPDVRERVQAVARDLGYDAAPPRPAGSPPGIIGVVITDILNPFFAELVRGVTDEARLDGFGVMIYDTAEDAQSEAQIFRALTAYPLDGLIICASRLSTPELLAFYERTAKPLVVLNRTVDHPDIPCILVDHTNAMFNATNHLLALNHTRIAYLAGPGRQVPSLGRRKGVEMALEKAGLELRPEWCPNSYPNEAGGFQAMSAILSLPPSEWPTAVVTYNDFMALGALHAIRTHGLRVPEDISVIGCDDISMAIYTVPALTTISQPKQYMGKLAMQTMRRLLRGENIAGSGYILLESPLVVRGSTAPVGRVVETAAP